MIQAEARALVQSLMPTTGTTRMLMALLVLTLTGCGGNVGPPRARHSTARPSPCRAAVVKTTAPPRWAGETAGVPTPPSPFALATGARVAAFLFVWPLRAHLPPGEADKVLWAVDSGAGANGVLSVVARYRGARPSRRFSSNSADTAGPVFRTRLRFARAGCWRLSVTSGTMRATLDVQVRP